jgi:hypothetical protein
VGKDPQGTSEVRRVTLCFTYYAAVRPLFAAVLVSAASLLIIGCSAGSQGSGSTASTTNPASAKPSASASPSSSPTAVNVSAPSAPSASGQLRVRLRDAFPVQSSAFMNAIAAEAPDGSVFAAFTTQQGGTPSAPAGTAVYVVDGNGPVQVAEHPSIPVTALAADSTYLYVGGGNKIVEYARATGSIARTVTLAMPVRVMAVSAGKLWAVLGSSVTGPGQVVEITPASGAVATVGTDAANVVDVAAGPLGLYYVESGGATIVRVNPNGTHVEAATNQTVNQQLSGPAAVQAISIIGSELYVIHDAGQGMDSSSQTYDATSLSGPQGNAPGIAGSNHAVDTLAGAMDASAPDGSSCSGKACVGRYNVATGAITNAVTFPQNVHLSTLLGPYPAVVVFPASGHPYLARIG